LGFALYRCAIFICVTGVAEGFQPQADYIFRQCVGLWSHTIVGLQAGFLDILLLVFDIADGHNVSLRRTHVLSVSRYA
ncbi:MAG: hypothetical protein J07HQX50_02726, partial [Haloquadratum sp. J07HQX50]